MRTEGLKGALLPILIIASMVALAILPMFISSGVIRVPQDYSPKLSNQGSWYLAIPSVQNEYNIISPEEAKEMIDSNQDIIIVEAGFQVTGNEHENCHNCDYENSEQFSPDYEINENRKGLGCILENINKKETVEIASTSVPPSYDWRDYGVMTSVKNQGSCGSCVAFGTIGAFEAVIQVEGGPSSDLSEAHLFFCGGGNCGAGMSITSALNYLLDYGTPDESCFPYQDHNMSCSDTCSDWQIRAKKISNWNWIAGNRLSIKSALVEYGPLVARFDVYTDFFSYTEGIYHYTWGDFEGGHCVALVGYNEDQDYWICKNSWGSSWGESGYFRIGYGECGIENSVAYLEVEVAAAIYIDGNDNFFPANGVVGGTGTENDPYIIENWDISAENANGIEIRNTTAYFVVRNCVVENGGEYYNGICLYNVVNGRVENNTCKNNDNGIKLGYSNNNTIVNNIARNNAWDGIDLDYSDGNILDNNACENNPYGINLCSSSNNTLKNNTFVNNGYGIRLDFGPNWIYHNNFVNNENQAYDSGTNYWDDGYPSGGNYWSDYTGEDNYRGANQDISGSDRIGDAPYSIPGGTNQDHYPLVDPWPYVRLVFVKLTISPTYASGSLGATVSYTVTITNMGNVVDNYGLSVGDNSGWDLDLSDNRFENVMPDENRMATLSVIIPENAELGAEDLITVTATSHVDNTVSDNDSCIAYVEPWTGTAAFSLVSLYTVNVEKILDLNVGSKLVVKFYNYGDAFENENIIENFSPPWHVEENENARHPEGLGVKKARLDLTTDDTENVISTIASFTVRKVDLEVRFMEIPMYWAAAPPAEKVELEIEFTEIPMYWTAAPF